MSAVFSRIRLNRKQIISVVFWVLFCIMTLFLFTAAASAGTGNEASGYDFVPPGGKYTSAEELKEKCIGILTGSCFDNVAREQFPDAELLYYSSPSDLIEALSSGKIDAFLYDKPVLIYLMGENDRITYIPESLASYDYAFAFPRSDSGAGMCNELSEYIRQLKSDGTLDQILNTWLLRDDENRVLADYKNFPAVNGTLIMATDSTCNPFSMVYNGAVTGVDIDIAVRFCEDCGYGLTISDMSTSALMTAIQSGKADFAGAGISVTPEREESVDFSEPYCTADVVLAVLKSDVVTGEGGSEEKTGVWEKICSSFEKTFIRENRWELFVQGLLTTLTITIEAILFGTLLGFVVFMLCRNGNRLANGITRVCLWLVQGMPTVVLLMVFYYIVFGSSSISGSLISVICFTLVFAAAVFGLLKMGVGAVDKGQYEAAYALGYSNRRTFFKVILPQALPHVAPSYKGEITGLIKATSVVGYIAVQDLTKMGDIVRSRTYEAFFPLIAVAVIYFILEGLLSFITGRISRILNPKRRKAENILKGINPDDRNAARPGTEAGNNKDVLKGAEYQ